jgi:hypothetical protein
MMLLLLLYTHTCRMSVMLESAKQAQAAYMSSSATGQHSTSATVSSGNLATAFKAVHTRITGTCNCHF